MTSMEQSRRPMRLVVGISGASGAIYGIKLLENLRNLGVETFVVISPAGEITIAQETGWKIAAVKALATKYFAANDMAAPIASGSYPVDGMIVAPCSVKTMAEIATGVTTGLIARTADVMLKEQRRLVLMLRETPLHAGHLRNALTLAEMGAIIAPPVPAFYAKPADLDAMVNHTLGRILDLFGVDSGTIKRWGVTTGKGKKKSA